MNQPKRIDGRRIADEQVAQIAQRVAALTEQGKRPPGLAVVMVGDNPASDVYVRNKIRRCEQAGILSREHRLDERTTEEDLLGLLDSLNQDPQIDGILVQLPLPAHLEEGRILKRISPAKDVDGFHPVNVGLLGIGDARALVPCTPAGCVILAKEVLGDLTGKHVVVVGRSNIVGKPAAQLFLAEDCSVTLVHSKSANGAELARQADILVVAVGRPQMVDESWVKPGAVVIDVGINRIDTGEGTRLVGDVDYQRVAPVAGAITPVPGGVGPMTIAGLLNNTLTAYEAVE
ncbi:bifunctional methylenetetrahydrofolate dehydrogenase/methenyltetrahydrofolate cyclohydrolase FolD [Ferrimonas sediminicola]|uniref:Bifunctional protein FolD n=1 Tax=Ferrimonas sediminicola TaxID=2569538 RepID=A0A4U1BHW6_9GAMM|nr:bifunctional methylenetetrahydrofolate dehydrogenase/methenyltetrahydrofolate cyclohydrolase FolD [Ferrimonas sediminicola]TKB50366.1 bifunctional methylenetetrahydrofolate dehydrogenase/methenyltetrahydrofolate cyclohydrolase FolD [Ferrimonas sediminicola]